MAKRRAGGRLLVAMTNPTPADERPEPERPPHAAPVTPSAPSRWTGGRIVMIVVGSLLALIALGAIASGTRLTQGSSASWFARWRLPGSRADSAPLSDQMSSETG